MAGAFIAVEGVDGSGKSGVVRRLVAEVAASLVDREQQLRALGLDGVAALRAARRDGRLPDGAPGDLLLVIDGWGSFRHEFEDLEPTVQAIAARGLALIARRPRLFLLGAVPPLIT